MNPTETAHAFEVERARLIMAQASRFIRHMRGENRARNRGLKRFLFGKYTYDCDPVLVCVMRPSNEEARWAEGILATSMENGQ